MDTAAIALSLALFARPTSGTALPDTSPGFLVERATLEERPSRAAAVDACPGTDSTPNRAIVRTTARAGLLHSLAAAEATQTQAKPYDAYEAGRSKKRLGWTLMLAGAATISAGFVVAGREVDRGVNGCPPGSRSCGLEARKGTLVASAGAGVLAGGLWVFHSAVKALRQLEAQKNK